MILVWMEKLSSYTISFMGCGSALTWISVELNIHKHQRVSVSNSTDMIRQIIDCVVSEEQGGSENRNGYRDHKFALR